eukprot:3154298-Amphidinium_carterae.1
MLALSLLLSDGATVLDGQSQSQLHDQFIDGPRRPKTECFYDEYTGMGWPREGVITARHEEMAYMKHTARWKKHSPKLEDDPT